MSLRSLRQLITVGRVAAACSQQGVRRICTSSMSGGIVKEEKPMESLIRKKLTEAFEPVHFEVINESYMHKVPKGAELHFRVLVVSEKFENVPMLKRHRMINTALKDELSSHVHALAIVAKTPTQWKDGNANAGKSPTCLGGMGL